MKRPIPSPLAAALFASVLSTASAQTTATWTLAGNGNWSTGANWSTNPITPINGQPLAGDTYNAVLNTARTITVDVPVSIQGFSQSTGTISGTGNLTILGGATWSGGTMTAAGETHALGGTILEGGVKSISTNRHFNNGDGVNTATATWTSGELNISNGGTFNNKVGSAVNVDFEGVLMRNGSGGVGTFNNAGVFNKNVGTGASTISSSGTVVFNNTGTLNHKIGTLSINSGGTHSNGVFDVTSGATLRFGGGTHTFDGTATVAAPGTAVVEFGGGTADFNAGSYSVSGTTRIQGGTANFNTAASTNLLTVSTGGVLGGTADFTANGLTTWSGGTMSGAGVTKALGGMTLDGGRRDIRSNRQVNNGDGVNPSTATWTVGPMDIAGGGIFNNMPGSTVNLEFDGIILQDSSAGSGTFNNAGIFNKNAGGGTAIVAIPFTNTGTVNINSGTLRLGILATHTGIFHPGAGGTLEFNAGTHTLDAGASFTGPGITSVTGATMIVNAPVSVAGAFSISSGSVNGTGSLTILGVTTWSGGTMTAAGETRALGGTVLGGGAKYIFNNRHFDNGDGVNPATTTWTSGELNFSNGGAFNNKVGSIVNVDFEGVLMRNSLGGVGTFNNAGVFNKNVGTGTSTISSSGTVVFNNTGTLNVFSGTLAVQGGVTQHSGTTLTGGTWNVTNGASIDITTGSDIQTSQASVTLDGPASTFARFTAALNDNQGSLTLKNDRDLSTAGALANSGTLRVEDSDTLLTVNGSYTQTAGSTTLVGGAQLATNGGDFLLQGGTLAGTGTVNGSVVSSGSSIVSPGASTGILTLASANLSGGTTDLAIEIGGADPGAGHDQLVVTGGLDLGTGSTLSLTLIDDFIPTFGVTFTLVDAGSSITGSFSNVANGGRLFVAGGEYSFKVNYGSSSPFGADKVVLSDFSDALAPVLALPDDLVMEATAPLTPVNFTVTAEDAIQGPVPATATPPSGTTYPVGGPATVNVTATDIAGNVANGSFTVTITDTTAPAFTVFPNDITAVEATGPGGAVVTYNVTATDIVDPAVALTFSHASGSTFPVGTTVVTVTATDDSSNSTMDTFSVTVVDTTAPVLGIPDHIVGFEATGPGGAEVSFVVTATDVVDGAMVPSVAPASGSVFPVGTTTVNIDATDAAGNEATGSFTVQVVDTTPPVITAPAAPLIAEATGSTGAVVDFSALISASDLVDAEPELVAVPASGSMFPIGDTLVTLTSTDSFDNDIQTTFIVRVQDTTDPDLTLPDIVAEATSLAATNVAFTATASDIVDGNLTSSILFDPAGPSFGFGETTVTASVTDAAENEATGSFTVTIQDTTPPTLNGVPTEPLTVFTTSATGTSVAFPAFSASDLPGSTDPTIVANPPTNSNFPLGTTGVTVTATDHVGLQTIKTFDVIVIGQTDIGVQETGGPEIADGGALGAFGATEQGSSSPAKSIIIRNDGVAPLSLGAVSIDGDHPGDFAATNPAETDLAPGQSTTFTVTFTPVEPGPRQAILHLASNDPDTAEATFDIFLSGTGIHEPLAVTGAASGLTYVGATLNGSVTANFADATVTFEYGTTSAYGDSIAATPSTVTGGDATAVSASLHALLLPETTYHFRVRAENALGVAFGEDRTFTTPPPGPGQLDVTFNPDINGRVISTVVQPDAKILILGYFTMVNGVERHHLARLNADGSLDGSFNPAAGVIDLDFDTALFAMALQADGKVLVSGLFETALNEPRNHMVRFNSDGSHDEAFEVITDGGIGAILIDTLGRIVIGGTFTTVNSTSRAGVARLDSNGNVDPGFDPASSIYGGFTSFVYMALQGDQVVVCGQYVNSLEPTRAGIARLTSTGDDDPGFAAHADGITAVAVQPDGKLVITGYFSTVNGQPKPGIARLNQDGTLDGTYVPGVPDSSPLSLAMQTDGKLLAASAFTQFGVNSRPVIARLLFADGALDGTFDSGSDDNDLSSVFQQPDGRVLIGGEFTSINGLPRQNLARLQNGPAAETLSVTASNRVEWLRSGTSPDTQVVFFESSIDAGASWQPLGPGTRIAGGWEYTGAMPSGGIIRANARISGGLFSGSSGLVQSEVDYGNPTISDIANQTIDEDTALAPVAFTIGDPESPASALTVSATSSNASLVTSGGIALGGSDENRTIGITPLPDQSGTATITVTVSDGTNTTSHQFVLTVDPVNDAPTIGTIADATIFADASAGPTQFSISDPDSDLLSLAVTATSDNPTLVPPSGIVIAPVGIPVPPFEISGQKTIAVTPAAGKSGTATITVTASDGQASSERTFLLTVLATREISVELVDGIESGGTVDFGSVTLGSNEDLTFTIRNLGLNQALSLTGDPLVEVVGGDFTVTAQPSATVGANDSTTFTVRFAPATVGAKSAQLVIASNDVDEESYTINLTGNATSPVPPAFAAPPVITPATATTPAKFSASVTGPPGAVVHLEASTDLGLADPWQVIGQVTLDGAGSGAFIEVEDPGSIGGPADFYRLRKD